MSEKSENIANFLQVKTVCHMDHRSHHAISYEGGENVKLTKKEISGAVVVGIEGKLIGGPENSDSFHSFFKTLITDGHKNIIINLHKTPWANSQGIGMLIGAHTSVANAEGELVLSHVADRINDILTVTRLALIFKTFETDDDAAKYLTKS
jgi:anti-anti-sigma factor